MDLKEAGRRGRAGVDHVELEREAVADAQAIADLLTQVHTCPKPVVAALNGDALAGGAGLAMACDLVVAGESARLGYPEVKRGLVAAIVMHDLTRQVGDRRARQLLLSGDLISAKLAHDWGMINTVTTANRCLDEAIRVANGLVESGRLALATTKRLLDEAAGRPSDLRGAAAESAAIRCSPEAREGIRAFAEKRLPTWAQSQPEEQAP
jgi:methylglutaconyl-CoA hydratase